MISATHSLNGAPKGQELCKKVLSDQEEDPDLCSWILRPWGDSDKCWSELFVSGRTAIWTDNGHTKKILKAGSDDPFTPASCFFNTFHDYPQRPSMEGEDQKMKDLGQAFRSACLLEGNTLKIYYETGQDFLVAIPVALRKIWPSKYGLILERECQKLPNPDGSAPAKMPVWFSLLHPLDDFSRIIVRIKNKVQELTSDEQTILFVSEEPSLCVTANTQTGQHSVWWIGPASPEDSSYILAETSRIQSLMDQQQQHPAQTPYQSPLSRHHRSNIFTPGNSPFLSR